MVGAKKINDKFGHNYGDMAIKAISEVLKSSCRTIDIAARMGGEEFNVILPGVDTQGGLIFAERIRKTIESIPLEKIGHITASIGVGTYMEHARNYLTGHVENLKLMLKHKTNKHDVEAAVSIKFEKVKENFLQFGVIDEDIINHEFNRLEIGWNTWNQFEEKMNIFDKDGLITDSFKVNMDENTTIEVMGYYSL